jgi:hypothetical protein
MEYLADTNIYLRLVSKAVASLLQAGNTLLIASQSVYEFWAVATRPVAANGLGWSTQQTRSVVDWLTTEFELVPDSPDAYMHWLELVTTHSVSGKPTHLLNSNGIDFNWYTEINAVHPSEVSA